MPRNAWGVKRHGAAVCIEECGITLVDTTVPDCLTHTVAPLSLEAKGLSTK